MKSFADFIFDNIVIIYIYIILYIDAVILSRVDYELKFPRVPEKENAAARVV